MARNSLSHGNQPVAESQSDAPLLLVVDDEPVNVELLMDLLDSIGYRVEGARSGQAALELARSIRPDLILLDVMMPGMTGIEVCRALRADPATAKTPVVFVTALAETEDKLQAIEAGGDDFITKPFNRPILLARIRSLLRMKSMNDELERSYVRLRDAERMKEDLIRMIVHDLRSPLATVLGSLELVVDGDVGPLSQQQYRLLTDAQSRGGDALMLVNDLLDITRLEDSHLVLSPSELDVADFLDSIIEDWTVRSERRGIQLERVSTPGLRVAADDQLLRRVFWNLIGNAARHAGEGVQVRLEAEEEAKDGTIRFSVTDDGRGVDPALGEKVFQKFMTGDAPEHRRSSGLGLTFCKLAVEAHGGTIWIDRERERGAAFHFTIPTCVPPVEATVEGSGLATVS